MGDEELLKIANIQLSLGYVGISLKFIFCLINSIIYGLKIWAAIKGESKETELERERLRLSIQI